MVRILGSVGLSFPVTPALAAAFPWRCRSVWMGTFQQQFSSQTSTGLEPTLARNRQCPCLIVSLTSTSHNLELIAQYKYNVIHMQSFKLCTVSLRLWNMWEWTSTGLNEPHLRSTDMWKQITETLYHYFKVIIGIKIDYLQHFCGFLCFYMVYLCQRM